jgi:hypothetical protein
MRKLRLQLKTLMLIVAFIWPMISVMGQTLIISEVADPGDVYQARFVELYNATDAPINLTGWQIRRYANANTTSGDIDLAGEIASGETFVIASSESDFTTQFGFAPDQSSGTVSGNGDDTYELFNGTDVVDIYGEVGTDGTGEAWEYEDSHGVRIASIGAGNTTWTASEWTIAAAAVAGMTPGDHTCDYPGGSTITPEKLAITSIDPTSPIVNTPFALTIESQDASGVAGAVTSDTDVQISLDNGTGNLSGTLTQTITSGTSSVTFTDLSYDAEEAIEVSATATSGMGLTASSTYTITISPVPTIELDYLRDFETGDLNTDGWTTQLITGTIDWAISSYGGDTFAEMSNNGNSESETWFISPIIDLTAATNPIFGFNNACGYDNGADIEVYVSDTYDGISSPDPNNWVLLTPTLSAGSYDDVYSSDLSLIDYIGGSAHVAFRYTGTATDGKTWQIDDITIEEGPVGNVPVITAVTTTPAAPTSSDPISVSANVTDADGDLSTVKLKWGTASDALSTEINMTASGDVYTTDTDIPEQADGAIIYYEIVATDGAANEATSGIKQILVHNPATATMPYSQDFETGLGNIYTYNVSGETKEWYHDGANGAAAANGYNSGDLEEDWLILPAVDLSAKAINTLTFDSWYKYGTDDAGNYLKLYYSKTYAGTGDPAAVSDWTVLTFERPSAGETWTTSGNVDLSGTSGTNVYLAFKYHYNSGSYRGWSIDNIVIDAIQVAPEITNISATPTAPMSADIVTVSADVNDADGTITSVELQYGLISGTYSNTVTMNTAKGTYTGEIPAMTDGTDVYYQIVATDNEMNETTSDEQSYTVVNEAIALAITATNPVEPYIGQAFTVTVNSHDINGSASPVDQATEIMVELTTGAGTISGTYTGTISMDQSSVTIGDLMYDVAENIEISASITSGMALANSATYSMTIGNEPAEPIVFFSEYSEADGGNNKYVEVYNATGEDIDLTGIVVKLASNGGDWGNTHELTGTLADGDVYLIANSGAGQEILDIADATSSITYFNGNDAVGLFVNDVLVDAIGVQGVDPGAGWDVAGITEATANHTLVRKYGVVTVGNTDWTTSAGTDADDSEWIVMDWNDYTNAGWHGEPIITPVITNVAIAPVNPTPEDIVTVSAMVTDSDATLTSVELQYGFTAGTYTSTVTMTNEVDNDYIAEIPAQVLGTTVYFVIAAEDENGVVLSEEQSYEVAEALPGLADIAALRQSAADGTEYTLAGEAILTFQQSNRNQKYIQDATGGILIDDNSGNITTTYNRYDGITGIAGTLSVYNGLLQFIPVADPGAATSTDNAIAPEIATIDVINANVADYESELITLEGVTFEDAGSTFSGGSNLTLSDGTNTITFRTNFYDADYIGEAIPAGPQNITALVGQYNGTAQVTAREFADMVSTQPVIANITATPVEPSSADVVTVTTDVTDGNGTITSVDLDWGTATGELTNTVAMTAEGDTYTAEIPAQADGTVVYYAITAEDNDANATVSAEMSYEVIDYNVATQLSISTVSPASPYITQVFSVEVTALDAEGAAGTVSEDTEVQVNLATGSGALAGETTGIILSGTTSVTISGLTYDVAETIMVNASTVSGMSLTASADFEVVVAELPDVPLVFISEYIEGSSNNKALEIYNGTGAELDLTGYSVQKSSNGDGAWGSEEALTGTLAAGDVFVIANSQSVQAILDVADVTSSVTYYNGNDAVGLFYNGELIDVIGVPSEDIIWDVAGVTEAALNHTLTRKYPDVIMGNTDWAASAGTNADDSEWIVSDVDDFSGIGWHGVPSDDPVITNITATPDMPTSDDAVTVSATVTSPIGTIASVTLDWGTTSGDLTNAIAMTADVDTYSAEIPAQADGTTVFYAITAEDDGELVTVSNEMSYAVNDPSIVQLPYSEDYTDNTFGELRTFSVVGNDQVWEVADYGNPAPGAKVTGYAGQNYANEDWMITPGLDLSAVTEAKMVFDEAINYATDVNSEMPIMVSTDYTGAGDPTTATWTELTVTGRSTGDNWDFVTVNEVNLTAYAGEAAIYIGFKYTSTTEGGATWEVDNILVEEGAALVAPVIENITLSPAQPTPDDAVTVSATITDGDGTIETAILHWGTDVFFGNTIEMSIESGDTWVSNEAIPAQASETQVFYKIVATDNDANSTSTDNLFYFSFQPYTGELPYFEPFYYGLGTMSETSVTGDQTWRWDEYGYAKVSGYAGSNYENEDWLITPELDFSTVESTVVLNFREAINYAVSIADEQKVMISTDYDGTSAPSTATWTELNITNRPAGDSWTFVSVDQVDLTDYVGETSVHIAFKYTSTTEGGATWEVDEISVSEDDAIIFGASKEMSIYPNPAQNTIFMNGVSTNTMVHIFDVNGKAVLNSENTNNTIDVSELNDGLYIIRVIDGSDVYTTRFIKE